MRDKYRIRSGLIVQLESTTLCELAETSSAMVGIDGIDTEITIDGTDRQFEDDTDATLTIGFDGVRRLLSGFPAHFIGHSDFDDRDVLVMAESAVRLAGEDRMVAGAGYVTSVTNEETMEPIDADVDIEDTPTDGAHATAWTSGTPEDPHTEESISDTVDDVDW